jgi:hypothetical protein
MGLMGRFLLSLSNAFSEKYLRSDQIDAFVQSESRSLLGEIRQKGFSSFLPAEQERILRIQRLLPSWGVEFSLPDQPDKKNVTSTVLEGENWRTALPDGRVINKGVLVYPCAGNLLAILESGKGKNVFLDENMELLLRHVEVKREGALAHFSRSVSKEERWQERCRFVVLFCRYAQRKDDWRFLNAALKLSGWLWEEYRRPFSTLDALDLLMALVEQEAALQEMQAC